MGHRRRSSGVEVVRSSRRDEPPVSTSRLGRFLHRLEWFVFPLWLEVPLVLLGATFVGFYPLAVLWGAYWEVYGLMVVTAVLAGWWLHSRYRVQVLEHSERGVVLWLTRRRRQRGPTAEPARPSEPSA